MKLIQQASLWFSEGNSDKVYEADLCDVGNDRYVVNFRYGRRGNALRDGTKTPLPVKLPDAQKIFNLLVSSKTKEGYQLANAFDSEEKKVADPVAIAIPENNEPNVTYILARLQESAYPGTVNLKKTKTEWPLSRVIWRAGQLQISQAAPNLIRLLTKSDSLQQYCIIWTLGRCNDKSAIPLLEKIRQAKASSSMVQRIALVSLLALTENEAHETLLQSIISELPQSLQKAIHEKNEAAFQSAFGQLQHINSFEYIEKLYLLSADYTYLRPFLINTLHSIPFQANAFKFVRHIFKIAEFRDDTEIFGLLAYRFETTGQVFNQSRSYWNKNVYVNGQSLNPEKELVKEDSRLAYSNKTRDYLRRRAWRTLRTLGKDGNELYTKMAVATLLPFSDEKNATPARQSRKETYEWRTRQTHISIVNYDSYANYWIINHILYENSPRYHLLPNRKAWRCRNGYEPGQPAPDIREEAFPALWDKYPTGLLQLLTQSQCGRVHEFAVKAVKANPDLPKLVNLKIITQLLSQPYLVTINLGLDLVKAYYDPKNPDVNLVRLLIQSPLPAARALAIEWMEANLDFFLNRTLITADLIVNPQEDTWAWSENLLKNHTFSNEQTELIVARVLSEVLSFGNTEANQKLVAHITEVLLQYFSTRLQTLGLPIIQDLLKHLLPETQALAGRILLIHQTALSNLPQDTIERLIESPYPLVRQVGVRLFGILPDNALLAQYHVLLAFCVSQFTEIREAIRPTIQRLAKNNAQFGYKLVAELIPFVQRKEAFEGLHEAIFTLIEQDLIEYTSKVDKDTILELVFSQRSAVQKLGNLLLYKNIQATDIPLRQMVKLANHEMLEVRQWVWQMYQKNIDLIKAQPEEALRILDANWQDSRQFGFEFFRTNFNSDDWTPALLVSVCDSTREDVQQFGRELITRFFAEENGTDYLLKLSQHPSQGLQLFATHYLEQFATGNLAHLQALEPYFITILSQVNRAGVAKKRIFSFLQQEARNNIEAAHLVARILTRQSLTMAVADKATCLQLMRDIHKQYPDIELPLAIKPIPTHLSSNVSDYAV